MREARPSRRAVLATGSALALSACLPGSDGEPPADPDLRVRRRVADEVSALGDAYALAVAAHPSLAARLAPLAAEHREHVRALGGRAASMSPSPSGSGAGSPSAPAVPSEAPAAVAWLAGLERQAARRRQRQVQRVKSPAAARLIASIGGCEAAHAALLGRGGAG